MLLGVVLKINVQLHSHFKKVLIRCPYPDCQFTFEAGYDLPEGDWHWREGDCPQCGNHATMHPVAVFDAVNLQYEKKAANGTLRGGHEAAQTPIFYALVEDVRSLWNVGAMFRTSDGAGVTQLYLCGVTGSPPRKEISKTSLGAEETVGWEYMRSAIPVLLNLRSKGVQIIGLERAEGSVALSRTIEQRKLKPPVCLVVGNEVMGISAESQKLCDLICHLPMRGHKESLNAAVAFGIATYLISDSIAPV